MTLFRWSKSIEHDRVEWWETELTAAGFAFVLDKQEKWKRWKLSVYGENRADCEELRKRYGGGVARLRDEDWKPALGDGRGIIRIRDRLIVTESGEKSFLSQLKSENPGREILSFPPQLAFGTGFHPTTAGCLRLLADAAAGREPGSWSLLDLGCGSGILSVAAARLGAGSITALELDSMALGVARGNAERHGLSDSSIDFREADAVQWLRDRPADSPSYSLVAANLFSSLLVEILPLLDEALAPDGSIILSGFLTSQTREVRDAAEGAGFRLETWLRRGKWVAAAGGWGEK